MQQEQNQRICGWQNDQDFSGVILAIDLARAEIKRLEKSIEMLSSENELLFQDNRALTKKNKKLEKAMRKFNAVAKDALESIVECRKLAETC